MAYSDSDGQTGTPYMGGEYDEQDPDSVDVNLDEENPDQDAMDFVIDELDDFWPAEKDPDELYESLRAKEEHYLQTMERRGLIDMYRLMFAQYFGLNGNVQAYGINQWATQTIQFAGEDGELIEFSANELRSFVDQLVNMMTKNRPAFECEAINTDYASMAQCEADDSMVTYFYEQENGERREKELAKMELMYGKAFIHIDWDPDAGPQIDVPDEFVPEGGRTDGAKVKAGSHKEPTGKFEVRALFPWEVISEPGRSEHVPHQWRIVVLTGKSKAEAMLRWPVFAQEIKNVSSDDSEWGHKFPGTDYGTPESEDACTWRVFYYQKCAALPNGRKVIFVGDVQVEDEDLDIDTIPVHTLMSCELHGTSFGISDMWNLIPLEQMQNQVLSDMATNVEAFGRPPLVLPEGADIDLDALANGQKVIFLPEGTVSTASVLKFPEIPPISFKLLELLRNYKQSISQLNAVERGESMQGVSSGAHAALYEQKSLEAQSPRVLEITLAREAVCNIELQFLKKYATHPQMVAIVGADERPYLKTFTKDDFSGVSRVKVKSVNPMMATTNGKLQIADMLRQWPGNPITDPQQIIDLITTGKMKPMYNLTRTIDLRIRWENEQLMKGPAVVETQPQVDPMTGQQVSPGYPRVPTVPANMLENIQKHVVNHMEVLYSPEAQENPAVLQAVLAHIQEHVELWKVSDPSLAQVLGNPPPPQAQLPPENQKQAAAQQTPGGVPPGGEPQQKQVDKAAQAVAPATTATTEGSDDSKSGGLPKPSKPAQAPGQPSAGPQQSGRPANGNPNK